MGKAPVLGPPKTEARLRPISIPDNVMPVLSSHLELLVGPEPDAWLFATKNGTALSPRNLGRVWNKVRALANVRPEIRLHDYADVRVMPMFPRTSSSPVVSAQKLSA
jgi:hypothetical protein